MRTGFPLLSRFLSKLVEIVGAGLASAAGAFLLGHIATPSSSPPPAVVQIVPADADTIRMVRGVPATVEDSRQEPVAASQPAAEALPAPATAVKVERAAKAPAPALTPTPNPARREHKATARIADAPVRIQPTRHAAAQPAGSSPAETTAAASTPAPARAQEGEGFRLFAALRQIPTWLLPSSEHIQASAPRPPMPVGQFWQSTM